MFPSDAKTVNTLQVIAGSVVVLPDGQYTILNVGVGSTGPVLSVDCSGVVLGGIFSLGEAQDLQSYFCDGVVTATMFGVGSVHSSVTYVSRDVSLVVPDVPLVLVGDFSVSLGLGIIIFILMYGLGIRVFRR